MTWPERTCPKCGAALKYEKIMARSVVFPCPACGIQLQFPNWYMDLVSYGAIAAPALIFWALGFSWPQIIVAELLLGYPILWVVAHYAKYIPWPKLVVNIVSPMSFKDLFGRTELRLRDRPPRPPWV